MIRRNWKKIALVVSVTAMMVAILLFCGYLIWSSLACMWLGLVEPGEREYQVIGCGERTIATTFVERTQTAEAPHPPSRTPEHNMATALFELTLTAEAP